MLDWFGQFGYKIPFGVSIADYILDISLGEAGYSNTGKTGSAAITELYTAFESHYGITDAKQQQGQQPHYFTKADLKLLPAAAGSTVPAQQVGKLAAFDGIASAADGNSRQIKVLGFNSSSEGLSDADSPTSRSEEEARTSSSCDMVIRTGASNLVAGSGDKHQHGADGSSKGRRLQRAYYWDQLRVLTHRAGRVRRFEQMTGQHFFQLFAVAFITGERRACCDHLPLLQLHIGA